MRINFIFKINTKIILYLNNSIILYFKEKDFQIYKIILFKMINLQIKYAY